MKQILPYKYKLAGFEGPLEVLLQLIEEQKLDITEISLAKVTDQFMIYINSLPEISPAALADFLVVAAKLLSIKSRILMNSTVVEDDEEASELEAQLKIYQEYHQASKLIARRLLARHFMYHRAKAAVAFMPKFAPPVNLKGEQLPEIFSRVLAKLQPIIDFPGQTLAKIISITEKIAAIKNMIVNKLNFGFRDLLSKGNKTELVVSFLAVLELVKQQTITVNQPERFADIEIHKNNQQ